MGETGDSRRNLGLEGSAENSISPANLAVTLKQHLRLEIRAENGRFSFFLYGYSLDRSIVVGMGERVSIAGLRRKREIRRAGLAIRVQSIFILLLLVWMADEYGHNQFLQAWAARSLGVFGFLLGGTLAAFYAGLLIAVYLNRSVARVVETEVRIEEEIVVEAEAR
jgi:hypothetical protein